MRRWGFRVGLIVLRKDDTVPISAAKIGAALTPTAPSIGSEFPVPGAVPASAEGPPGILAME